MKGGGGVSKQTYLATRLRLNVSHLRPVESGADRNAALTLDITLGVEFLQDPLCPGCVAFPLLGRIRNVAGVQGDLQDQRRCGRMLHINRVEAR